MKRILLILSILMITGVSAQNKTKITNVYVNTTNAGENGDHIYVSWDAKKAKATYHRRKGTKKWYKAQTPPPGSHTYGIAFPKRFEIDGVVKDRTYQILAKSRGTGEDAMKKVRVIKIHHINNLFGRKLDVYVPNTVKENLTGKTIYLDNHKGTVTRSHASKDYSRLKIVFDEPITSVNPGYYLWFKQSI